jgi:hypothetical protein
VVDRGVGGKAIMGALDFVFRDACFVEIASISLLMVMWE